MRRLHPFHCDKKTIQQRQFTHEIVGGKNDGKIVGNEIEPDFGFQAPRGDDYAHAHLPRANPNVAGVDVAGVHNGLGHRDLR